jgi:hypothetical protein
MEFTNLWKYRYFELLKAFIECYAKAFHWRISKKYSFIDAQ